jgi:hypothetical protein
MAFMMISTARSGCMFIMGCKVTECECTSVAITHSADRHFGVRGGGGLSRTPVPTLNGLVTGLGDRLVAIRTMSVEMSDRQVGQNPQTDSPDSRTPIVIPSERAQEVGRLDAARDGECNPRAG